MKVTIYTADGAHVRVKNMPADDVAVLTAELHGSDPDDRSEFLTFVLDGDSVTYINRAQVTRVDVDA